MIFGFIGLPFSLALMGQERIVLYQVAFIRTSSLSPPRAPRRTFIMYACVGSSSLPGAPTQVGRAFQCNLVLLPSPPLNKTDYYNYNGNHQQDVNEPYHRITGHRPENLQHVNINIVVHNM